MSDAAGPSNANSNASDPGETSCKRGPRERDPDEIPDVELAGTVNETSAASGADQQIQDSIKEAAKLQPTPAKTPEAASATNQAVSDLSTYEREEPAPIPTHGADESLFPGMEPVTVAFSMGRKGIRYCNRYGPPTCPWYVLGTTRYGLEGDDKTLIESGQYQLMSDPKHRVLDYPHGQLDRGQRKTVKDMVGILHVVCDIPLDEQGDPLLMAERLNPAVVKQTRTYTTMAARHKASKAGKIGKYPATNVLCVFRDTVHPDNQVNPARSFELSSKYRAMHGAHDQFNIEETIYNSTKTLALRFLAYYKLRYPQEFAQWHASSATTRRARVDSIERTPSKSPEPVLLSVEETEAEPVTLAPGTRAAKSTPNAGRSETEEVTEDDTQEDNDADEELTEEEIREEVELAWKDKRNIPVTQKLTGKDKKRFELYYRTFSASG